MNNYSKYNILEICVDLDGGGIDRYLYNYCSRIKNIHFDFAIIDKPNEGILEPLIRKCGYEIYKVPRIKDGILSNYNSMRSIMKAKKYDAVHVHLGPYSLISLVCALLCGIKVRLVHAHLANVPESKINIKIRKALTFLTKLFATDLCACGIDAAKWVWGESTYNKGMVSVQNNAIITSDYEYNENIRKQIRSRLNIADSTLVVGHVGRISSQKNQIRIIDIFQEIIKLNNNTLLLLIGRGNKTDEEELRVKAKKLGILGKITFMGIRDDVPALLNAMDVFIFPSLFEGLPFTLIETQCNGLPCICSDSISSFSKVSDVIKFKSLAETDYEWAKESIIWGKIGHSTKSRQQVIEAGYDIDLESIKLAKYYISLIEKSK